MAEKAKANASAESAVKRVAKKRAMAKAAFAKDERAQAGTVRARKVLPRDVLGTSRPIDVNAVRMGLRVQTVAELRDALDLPMGATLKLIGLSKQTYQRRTKEGRLKPDESDRVWRIADLVAKATDLIGEEAAAVAWLRAPSPALDGESPLERANTEIGARDVERLMGLLEHGIPA